jgi:hypothetical protein
MFVFDQAFISISFSYLHIFEETLKAKKKELDGSISGK